MEKRCHFAPVLVLYTILFPKQDSVCEILAINIIKSSFNQNFNHIPWLTLFWMKKIDPNTIFQI